MHSFTVNTFQEWRNIARKLLADDIAPQNVIWNASYDTQYDLFAGNSLQSDTYSQKTFSISKIFIDVAEIVACHANPDKWMLLYQTLWRLTHENKFLLQISSDPLINKLLTYRKSIMRDMHKIKAFVRFKHIKYEADEFYIAWHKPDHHIVRLVAPFFKKRFAVMRWSILTPSESVTWDGNELQFHAGVERDPKLEDQIENLWLTYYRSIFNPARVKVKAMKNEMPVRYWPTMPETKLIPQLLQEAPIRVAKMIKEKEGFASSAKDFFSEDMTLAELRVASEQCKACHLHQCARQTVFGLGPARSEVVIVGEQPGLQEDLQGKPFVGPAGQVLRDAMQQAGVDAEQVYMTNAVKHFKHTVVAGKQIHRSPVVREVNACKPWVEQEIRLVKPKVILCLGNIAAKALIAPQFTMHKQRGIWHDYQDKKIIASFHPSAILRMPEAQKKNLLFETLVNDLRAAFNEASNKLMY